jgi:hypothetical protein
MSDRVYKVWLNSGANIHSCYEQEVSLSELGLTAEEFDELSEDDQDSVMRDVAWDRMDWGWTPKL